MPKVNAGRRVHRRSARTRKPAPITYEATPRAGDPHRHLHLQVNARVFAAGAWRGLHSVGVRDMIEAINGIGHAAVATDPEFRAAMAARGLTLDGIGGRGPMRGRTRSSPPTALTWWRGGTPSSATSASATPPLQPRSRRPRWDG